MPETATPILWLSPPLLSRALTYRPSLKLHDTRILAELWTSFDKAKAADVAATASTAAVAVIATSEVDEG